MMTTEHVVELSRSPLAPALMTAYVRPYLRVKHPGKAYTFLCHRDEGLLVTWSVQPRGDSGEILCK